MAMVLGAVAFYGPELARDLRYAGTFRVADDLRATGQMQAIRLSGLALQRENTFGQERAVNELH